MVVTPISLLLPIYNGIRFLPDIRVYASENCDKDDEILIVSDGSTDGTNEFLQSWANEDSRVRLILKKNTGIVDTLNIGLREAKFDWIARFDVDDFYPPYRLTTQRLLIAPDVVAIFADYEFSSENGVPLGRVPSAVVPLAMKLSLISGNRTAHPVVVFHKQSAINVGGYVHEDFPAEDLSLWMRIQTEGKIVSVPRVLLKYTLVKNSVTNSNRLASIGARNRLIKVHLDSLDFFEFFSNRKKIKVQFNILGQSSIRYVLFLKELKRLAAHKKIDGKDKTRLNCEYLSLFLNLKTIALLCVLLLQKTARSIYRKNQFVK